MSSLGTLHIQHTKNRIESGPGETSRDQQNQQRPGEPGENQQRPGETGETSRDQENQQIPGEPAGNQEITRRDQERPGETAETRRDQEKQQRPGETRRDQERPGVRRGVDSGTRGGEPTAEKEVLIPVKSQAMLTGLCTAGVDMLGVLVSVVLLSHGSWGLGQGLGPPAHGERGLVDLPWHDELCCSTQPSALHTLLAGGSITAGNPAPRASQQHPTRCRYQSLKSSSQPGGNNQSSGGLCWRVRCALDDDWENVVCNLKSGGPPPRPPAAVSAVISLQRLALQTQASAAEVTEVTGVAEPLVATGDPLVCSIALDDNTNGSIAVVTIAVLNTSAPLVRLQMPVRPVRPSAPVNVSHTQTTDGQLVLSWSDPAPPLAAAAAAAPPPRRYEVRYVGNSTGPVWQVLHISGEPRVVLDRIPTMDYILQVRSSLPAQPRPLWSAWSPAHHIQLDKVSYIPEKVVVSPGQNVTVYCVFNDRSASTNANASSATWLLNLNLTHPIPRHQSTPVSPWVSQVTIVPSENRLYDILTCTQWSLPYSQIYVEGASIDISCETNGDVDTMTCSWENHHLTKLSFLSRWADVPCDVMERRERAGQRVETSPASCQPREDNKWLRSCRIKPLRMNCYKLWLEVDSRLGPVRSRPVYVSPTDHVKPNQPSGVRAVSQSRRVLRVTWEPPVLPAEGLRCHFRHHSPSAASAQPDWKVQSPTRASWAEVSVADMCQVYVVQVRCASIRDTGYWSDWTESVYSVPQNSRAPDHGPDFWRVLEDDPHRNMTNVTLLLKRPAEDHSYCVDGFVVQHQASRGSIVSSEKIDVVSSYSFEWNQELHTVTVEAFNSLGSSASNTKMTLDGSVRRRCVESFQVEVINSTCVSLLWGVVSNGSAPLSMVVQWSAPWPQDAQQPCRPPWARLPYTQHKQYLRGDFFAEETYSFTVYPVYPDGEGEPAHTTATRRDPAAYMLLMIISFLSIVLFVTLLLSQNQMKRLVWKDVPNPYNCSWAKGMDFQKANAMERLFQLPDALPAWPLLLPTESFCEAVVIVDKKKTTGLPPPTTTGLHPAVPAASVAPDSRASGEAETVSSSQSSVAYATVLLGDPSDPSDPSVRLSYNSDGGGGGGGSSSNDEGNFSANNSDISGSVGGGLWELESCSNVVDPLRSGSYNSAEEFSVTSEQEEEEEDEGVKEQDKDLYYLGMDYEVEEEEEEEEEEDMEEEREVKKLILLKNLLLRPEEEEAAPVYLPQFKTVC